MFRLLVASLSLLAVPAQKSVSPPPPGDSQPFSEAWLQQRAQRLAGSEYVPPSRQLPGPLARLTYDDYRQIRFRPEAAIWHGEKLAFELQLFHLGFLYLEPVAMYVVDRGRARPVRYDARMFDFGATHVGPLPSDLGFAGFRVQYPINRKDRLDEVLAFLGASYFRALGQGNVYGLTARGLAVDTALPRGEVFPAFREFYVERPAQGGRHLVVHALLDSPSATGAYRFELTPGRSTEMVVHAVLFPRREIERLGLAPLASMYLHGENDHGHFDDYRPEVHDSDGLLIWFGNGERLWRPVQNPSRLQVSAFRAEAIKGFGLLQRDRSERHYEDLDARFERRPSAWVEPIDGFNAGSVFLVELPSEQETNDNVVAFFAPDRKVKPGAPIELVYRLRWGMSPEPSTPAATTTATYEASARKIGVPDGKQPYDASARKFIVDFAFPRAGRDRWDGLDAVVTSSNGAVKETRVEAHPQVRRARVTFDLLPGSKEPSELRCFLRRGDTALSETWSYRFIPPTP